MQVHGNVATFMYRIQSVVELWEDFLVAQEKTIPCLCVLKETSKHTLIDGSVIEEKDIYDFGH